MTEKQNNFKVTLPQAPDAAKWWFSSRSGRVMFGSAWKYF